MPLADQIDQLFAALENAEKMDYIGEPVSQLQHALQTAQCARDAGVDNEMIVAALLHDIGHTIVSPDAVTHEEVGVIDHDQIGGTYLRSLGFSERLVTLVQGHVDAKRYMVAINPSYAQALSPASVKTLEFQGGPMSEQETAAFREHPLMREILLLRTWDERAKVPDSPVEPLSSYRPLVRALLEKQDPQE